MEARGFIFGALAAWELGAGFVPLRKPGKLPAAIEAVSYALEYGTASLEVHRDALGGANRVLLVDDVLATGGTAAASVDLVERLGATVRRASPSCSNSPHPRWSRSARGPGAAQRDHAVVGGDLAAGGVMPAAC